MKELHNAKRSGRQFMLQASAFALAASAFAPPAAAQDDDEIIVTGTRIAREDLASPSPVTQVTSEQLVLTNTINTEQYLNTLPQVIPAFDSSSNNPGNGSATVQLRGLGTQRTLVLVDGMRFVGSGAGLPVDLNNVPAALVERVEIVTGGASAVYGSDAVTGVVNFILRDDFEGVQLDVSNERSISGWDGNTLNATITGGGNFADDRGNAVVSVSYTNRQAVFQGERDFSEFTFFDPGFGFESDGFIPGGSSSVPGTFFQGPVSGTFGVDPASIDPLCAGNECLGFFSPAPGELRGLRFGSPNDLYNYAPLNYLQLPQERYSIFGRAEYQINDTVEVYARGIFANSIVDSQLAPTPGGFTVAVPQSNPFLQSNPTLVNLLLGDPDANPGAPVPGVPNSGPGTFVFNFARRFEELGPRNSLRDTSTFQIAGGVAVALGDNWNWNTEAQFSRSSITQVQSGNVSISALREALFSSDGVSCDSGNSACVPIDIFNGPGSISAAAAGFISRTGAQFDTVEQTQFITTLAGATDAVRSPLAETGLGLAVGLEYREEFADSRPDSVLGPDVLGFNQSLPVRGRFDAYEAFAEVDLPLIEGEPFIESFSINGAYRYSDYSIANVGGIHAYAFGGEWEVVSGLRFRAQYQRAVRAPNIGELFASFTNGFPVAQDPCSGGTFGAFSADTLVATCLSTGVPAGQVGAAFQSNGQIEALFGGNPDLQEETADTITIGAVWRPDFIPGLTMQVDFYDIDIDDAIVTVPLQTILDLCHLQGEAEACDVIVRSPFSGEITSPFLPNLGGQNIGFLTARGIDIQAEYGREIGDRGSLAFVYVGSYTMSNGFQTSETSPFIECAGVFAGDCGQPTPEYKHTLQSSWLYGPLTTSVRWRYIGGTEADFPSALNGAACVPADFNCISDLSDNIGAFNYVDVTLQYAATENLDLTVGVLNITGKEPPLLGSTVAEQANTWPATYETLGRQLFVGASVRF